MNFYDLLKKSIIKNKSYVCVGLDTDLQKIPQHLLSEKDPLFQFNKAIIDATINHVAAYKPNMAFYEAEGLQGLEALKKSIKYIGGAVPVILDAKRGDIGNTSKAYAKSIFEDFKADAVTLSPYMGYDSIAPFMEYKGKGLFILCLTSNSGAADFQKPDLYKKVATKVKEWDVHNDLGLVVGATNAAQIKEVRACAPGVPFLVPGIGAQGGSLEDVLNYGMISDHDIVLINSSRNILYASSEKDFAQAAKQAAFVLQEEINNKLK